MERSNRRARHRSQSNVSKAGIVVISQRWKRYMTDVGYTKAFVSVGDWRQATDSLSGQLMHLFMKRTGDQWKIVSEVGTDWDSDTPPGYEEVASPGSASHLWVNAQLVSQDGTDGVSWRGGSNW